MSRMIQGIREAWCALTGRRESRTVEGQPIVDWLRDQEAASHQQTEDLRQQPIRGSPIERVVRGQPPHRRPE